MGDFLALSAAIAGTIFLAALIAAVFDKKRRRRWFETSGWAAIVLILVWIGMLKLAEYRGDLNPPIERGNLQQPSKKPAAEKPK